MHLPERIRSLEKNIQKYKEDCEFAKAHTISDDTFSITINGNVYTDKKAAIEELFSLENETMPGELNEIGIFRGFRLFMYKEMVGNLLYNLCLTVKNNLGYRVKLSKNVGTRNFLYISDTIDNEVNHKLVSAIEELNSCKHRLASAQEEIKEEFPKEAEYQNLLKEQAEINTQLTVANTTVPDEQPIKASDTANHNAIPHMRK